ncbi:MAG: hypothetical protein M0P12_11570 [Paludibacteraceae bacterium]|nr:hypothetical protein [Paludibacteraceae bacterium]
MKKIKHAFIASTIVLLGILSGCEAEHHDYVYMIKSSVSTPVELTYHIANEDDVRHTTLQNGETLRLCTREGVSGDEIWNIETSSTIFPISAMIATTNNFDLLTENLSIRNYWPSNPVAIGDSGIYTLNLTDDDFILSKKVDFKYEITSEVSDSIIVTSYIVGDKPKKDTMTAENNKIQIGTATIYAYNEKATKKVSERNVKMLSGLQSLSLTFLKDGESYSRSINLSKEDSLFSFSDKGCTMTIKGSIFFKTN